MKNVEVLPPCSMQWQSSHVPRSAKAVVVDDDKTAMDCIKVAQHSPQRAVPSQPQPPAVHEGAAHRDCHIHSAGLDRHEARLAMARRVRCAEGQTQWKRPFATWAAPPSRLWTCLCSLLSELTRTIAFVSADSPRLLQNSEGCFVCCWKRRGVRLSRRGPQAVQEARCARNARAWRPSLTGVCSVLSAQVQGRSLPQL